MVDLNPRDRKSADLVVVVSGPADSRTPQRMDAQLDRRHPAAQGQSNLHLYTYAQPADRSAQHEVMGDVGTLQAIRRAARGNTATLVDEQGNEVGQVYGVRADLKNPRMGQTGLRIDAHSPMGPSAHRVDARTVYEQQQAMNQARAQRAAQYNARSVQPAPATRPQYGRADALGPAGSRVVSSPAERPGQQRYGAANAFGQENVLSDEQGRRALQETGRGRYGQPAPHRQEPQYGAANAFGQENVLSDQQGRDALQQTGQGRYDAPAPAGGRSQSPADRPSAPSAGYSSQAGLAAVRGRLGGPQRTTPRPPRPRGPQGVTERSVLREKAAPGMITSADVPLTRAPDAPQESKQPQQPDRDLEVKAARQRAEHEANLGRQAPDPATQRMAGAGQKMIATQAGKPSERVLKAMGAQQSTPRDPRTQRMIDRMPDFPSSGGGLEGPQQG